MVWLKLLAKIVGGLIGLGVVGIGAFVIFSTILHNKPVILPAPTGPYPVGRVAYDWVDATRAEVFTPNQADKRELMAWVWYPAARQQADVTPAAYLPESWGRIREQDWGIFSFLMQRPASVQGHAVADAALAPAQARYPVLIFLPGLGPLASDYTTLTEELASHGYIVVAITPTYSASLIVFSDGQIAKATSAAGIPDEGMSVAEEKHLGDQLMQVWAADAIFAMNQAWQLNNDSKSRFAKRLDVAHMGIFGHSFGGATAAQACRLDRRCKAGINLDGYPYGDVAQAGLRQPFMFIWSETIDTKDPFYQQARRDVQAIYGKLPNGGYQLTIKGARHFNFTDLAVQYAPVIQMQGLTGKIEGQRGLQIVNVYTVAFFDKYLKNIDTPLLTSPTSIYPEIQFEAR